MSEHRCKTCHFAPCRCEDLASGQMGQSNLSACWPLESQALAVHAKQVQEATERNRRHGIRVDYKKDGTAVIPDRHERRKLLKLEGLVDKHSFTGG